jgi:HD-like signal output (HDOD) protein
MSVDLPQVLPPRRLSADEMVKDLKHLPSAPKVLPRLKELLGDANSSMVEVVTLIRLDPAIAARVLQVGNSAYFSQGTRCFTIDEAVQRVGYDQVYQLVSYSVASQVLIRPLVVYGIDADEHWKRSVVCALAAELLASRSGQDRDVAYTVGLLHSLGMVAIEDWASRHSPELRLQSEKGLLEASAYEQAALGLTQADVGAALLRHWEFPSSMCEPVQRQYAPRSSPAQMRMACLLHCAKWLRDKVCAADGAALDQLPESVMQMVPMRPTELPAIVAQVTQRLKQVSSLLDVTALGANRVDHRFPVATPVWSLR